MDGICETKDSLHWELCVNTVLPSSEDIRMIQCGPVPCNMVISLQNTILFQIIHTFKFIMLYLLFNEGQFYQYLVGLLSWLYDNYTISLVAMMQRPYKIQENPLCEYTMNQCVTTTN